MKLNKIGQSLWFLAIYSRSELIQQEDQRENGEPRFVQDAWGAGDTDRNRGRERDY